MNEVVRRLPRLAPTKVQAAEALSMSVDSLEATSCPRSASCVVVASC